MSKEPLAAQLGMKEFDPTKERHFPLLIVKAVDPGCTLELQIEVGSTGEVFRFTTTESADRDREKFEAELISAFRYAWKAHRK